jgi:DNA mismatch repair protein MutS
VFGEHRAKKPLSPVMRQYQEAKSSHPDAILLFRLGDFYEMFHEDAVVAARALDLTLTSRNKGAPDEVPMAGVPYHSAGGHIAKLLALGHKVAICEQMADPSKTRGIVPREVVRVLTPGLVTDLEQLDGRQNHFLCVIDRAAPGAPIGASLLDLSTAELLAAKLDDEAMLVSELARALPHEVLLAESCAELLDLIRATARNVAVRLDEPLVDGEPSRILGRVVGESAAAEAEAALSGEAVRAAARALRFANQCNPGSELPVRRVGLWDPGSTLRIDDVTQAHLELVRGVDGTRSGSLLSVLEEPSTPAGGRLLRRRLLAPELDIARIRRRLDAVEAFVANSLARTEL